MRGSRGGRRQRPRCIDASRQRKEDSPSGPFANAALELDAQAALERAPRPPTPSSRTSEAADTLSRVPPQRLTLVGKPDCHLCHEMRAIVVGVVGADALHDLDVRNDPTLERRYVFEIPVLLWGDVEVARHRTTAADLRERLGALGWR